MDRLTQLKAFLAEDPNDPFLYYALGQELVAQNKWSEAQAAYQHLLENFPDYLPTYYQFGLLLAQTGKPDEAVEVLGKGKKLAQRLGNRRTENEIMALIEDLFD